MASIEPQIVALEKASTGEAVRAALVDALDKVNMYHERKFSSGSGQSSTEGSLAHPVNDISVWLRCASIIDCPYTLIDPLLEDETYLSPLIASSNASDYLVRCTWFVDPVTNSESAMRLIGENEYCKELLLADETWAAAIDESPYKFYITRDGSQAVPINDVETWIWCGFLDDCEYTTMAEVLADHDILDALIADENACNYLVRSIGFAPDITVDEYAMTIISENAYCSSLLMSDSDWASAIGNSEYAELFVLSWQTWCNRGGVDPTNYSDLSEVIADELAVRQLMTKHDSVDYIVSKSDKISTIIDNDICAKWITISAYAYNRLLSVLGSAMYTNGKYGYGEYRSVENTFIRANPVMTDLTAPYCEIITGVYKNPLNMYKASASSSYAEVGTENVNGWSGIKFTKPLCLRRVYGDFNAVSKTFDVIFQGSNDGETWVDVGEAVTLSTGRATRTIEIDNDQYYLYYRFYFNTQKSYGNDVYIYLLEYYGQFYSEDYSEKEFAEGASVEYLYDHGLKLVDDISSSGVTEYDNYMVVNSSSGYVHATQDVTSFNELHGAVGYNVSASTKLVCDDLSSDFDSTNMPNLNELDISAKTGSQTVGVETTASGDVVITELWLE